MSDIKKAIALKYEVEKNNAPKVVAKGSRKIAEKIIGMAKEYGITIKEDKELVEILSKLDIGDEIPSHLYEVVAKIFAYVYSTKKRLK